MHRTLIPKVSGNIPGEVLLEPNLERWNCSQEERALAHFKQREKHPQRQRDEELLGP